MKTRTISKQNKKNKGKIFGDERKLHLALLITELRQFGANEVAEIFGTSRQAINYHMKKGKNENA